LGKETTAVLPAGRLAVAYQVPGLVAYSVCDHPEMGFHTSWPTVVLLPSLPVMAG
jgi:hypothetical protein